MSPYSCSVDPSGSGSARMKSRNPTQFPGPLYWELLTHGDVSLPDDLSRGGVSAHSFRVAWSMLPAQQMPFFKQGGCAGGRAGKWLAGSAGGCCLFF